jgi:hypothetical protein
MSLRLTCGLYAAIACGGLAASVIADRGESLILPPDAGKNSEDTPRMRLYAGPAVRERPFVVVAYFKGYEPGQTVRLILPRGLKLAPGQSLEKDVPASRLERGYAMVCWRLIGTACGNYRLTALAPGIGPLSAPIRVSESIGFE